MYRLITNSSRARVIDVVNIQYHCVVYNAYVMYMDYFSFLIQNSLFCKTKFILRLSTNFGQRVHSVKEIIVVFRSAREKLKKKMFSVKYADNKRANYYEVTVILVWK